MKKILKNILSRIGIEIKRIPISSSYNPFLGYDYSQEGRMAVELTKNYSMMPHINLFTLFEQAVYCEKKSIEGAFVECGVWKGGAVGIMAKANLMYGTKRRHLHLFDAFNDIPAPNAAIDGERAIEDVKNLAGIEDKTKMEGQLIPMQGFYNKFGGAGTIDICKELLENKLGYDSKFIHFHKGWFQDTVPKSINEIGPIAILRLDGDWYESIKVCIENLYDQVVPCGIIVIDDYGYYEGCTKAIDEFLEKRGIKTFLSYSNIGCRYFIKQ